MTYIINWFVDGDFYETTKNLFKTYHDVKKYADKILTAIIENYNTENEDEDEPEVGVSYSYSIIALKEYDNNEALEDVAPLLSLTEAIEKLQTTCNVVHESDYWDSKVTIYNKDDGNY
jgi:ketopantoate reductase